MANPQVERTHSLMLDAAKRLLESEGPDAVTHLRIAEAAGVGRATVYRHWPERLDILADLLAAGARPHFVPPVGDSPREQLAEVLVRFAQSMEDEQGRALALLVARAEWDDRFEVVREAVLAEGLPQLDALVAEVMGGGPPPEDVAVVRDALMGATHLRVLLLREPVDRDYVNRLLTKVLGQST